MLLLINLVNNIETSEETIEPEETIETIEPEETIINPKYIVKSNLKR
jgi:hypothetical protein